jgi:hypothetical protein
MPMTIMLRSIRFGKKLFVIASFFLCRDAFAQSPKRLTQRAITSETRTATCFDNGPTLVRSPILISPDGKYRAYSENEAVMRIEAGCINTAKLFVRGPGETVFRLVYLQAPTEGQLFSNIKPVDWSPDSHRLLSELFIGQWGSDFGENSLLLYDATKGFFSSKDTVGTALSINFGRDCAFSVRMMGFASDGGVVLKIQPSSDEVEGKTEQDSCVQREGLWLLKDGIKPLAATYRVRIYGRFRAAR